MACGPNCIKPSPAQAHCAATCHQTFSGVGGFDRHRRAGICLDPATLGMSKNGKGIWRTPMTAEQAEKLQHLRESAEQ